MEVLSKGGVFVYLILLFSVFSVAIFFEKLRSLRTSRIMPDGFATTIEGLLARGAIESSAELCRNSDSAIARIMLVAINNIDKDPGIVRELVESAGKQEVMRIGRFAEGMSAVAATTPLLGLLGTVFGIIKAFGAIAAGGIGNPTLLANGISEALFATAAGLGAAVISFIAYKYIDGRLTKIAVALSGTTVKILAEIPATAGGSPRDPRAE